MQFLLTHVIPGK